MEAVNIISIVVLLSVACIGAILKRYTKRTLSDMDGMGEVTSAQEANVIAKFK